MAAAVSLLRLPLSRLSTHLRSFPSSRPPPPRLRIATPHRFLSSLGHGAVTAAASEVVASSAAEEFVDATEESHDGTPAEAEAAEEAPRSFVLPRLPRPKLTVKERKELASYAHGLGKKLKSQQVGKSGVTPSLVTAFTDNLESNELLKTKCYKLLRKVGSREGLYEASLTPTINCREAASNPDLLAQLKIHGNCPEELPDVILKLEESTGSVVVDQIGRSVILYRPSSSKMKKRQDIPKSPRRFVKSEEALEERPRTSAGKRSFQSGSKFRAQQKRRPMLSKGSSYSRG